VTEWAAWGTSVGTLVLAGATFAAVRSSNRSARIAERALLAGMRPMLTPSRREDAEEQVQFADGRVFDVGAGRAMLHRDQAAIYLAIPVRNVGSGIALLRGYSLEAESAERVAEDPRGIARHRRGDPAPNPATFAEQQRDIYIPPDDVGFWQAALRDPADDLYRELHGAIDGAGRITVDLLYTDHEGGQPTITRFVLLPGVDERWRCDVTHHWNVTGAAGDLV
jgi:hypothetical protein